MKAVAQPAPSSGDWYEDLFDPLTGPWEDATVVLSRVTVDALAQQLNHVTPRHVRVAVESRKLGTGVMCESRFWGLTAPGAGEGAELRDHLVVPLLCVQNFVIQYRWQAWPGKEPISRTEYRRDWAAVVERPPLPGCVIAEQSARLWFGDAERPVLELAPIPL